MIPSKKPAFDQVGLRLAEDSDRPFIVQTWWKSLKDPPSFDSQIPSGMFKKYQIPKINSILDGCHTLIAHNAADEDQILGYLCCEKHLPVIHYLYVKSLYTDFGVARTLLNSYQSGFTDQVAVALSHLTLQFQKRFFNKKPYNPKYVYNPYILKELGYEA